jgi:ribosomal-protein-serine acetyltransferase
MRAAVTRAVSVVLDQAFLTLGLRRISLHTEVANKRSRALATRLGFTEEGTLRSAIAFGEDRRDDVVYGLLADEWRNSTG